MRRKCDERKGRRGLSMNMGSKCALLSNHKKSAKRLGIYRTPYALDFEAPTTSIKPHEAELLHFDSAFPALGPIQPHTAHVPSSISPKCVCLSLLMILLFYFYCYAY
jgi:hypothetical protein